MFLIDLLGAIYALNSINTATIENIAAGCESVAEEMESYAKANAPWQDRTGNARRTLEGFTVREADRVAVGVCGNMPYSPHLETGFHGRFAILVPTVDAYSGSMIDRVRSAVVDL